MSREPATALPATSDRSWRQAVAPYERPSHRRALWQVANSFIPYLALWGLMLVSLSVSYWLVLPLAALAAGFLVRIFIIGHDCGHGSFFRSRRANEILGQICFTMAFTPYASWRYQHSVHHASSGDLDRRDMGDVWTLTAKEYVSASRGKRLGYRLYRNPLVLFVLGPIFQFFIASRFWRKDATRRERASILRTNVLLAGIVAVAWLTIGLKAYVLIQLPVMAIAGSAGMWLFYVQHQFEGVYWERHEQWDYVSQALEGSSYYNLPGVLRWFSGNIGYHHVHHLSPRIPNYRLKACHEEQALFRQARVLTLRTSLQSLTHRLWDEERRELIGFGGLARGPHPIVP